MSKIQTNAKKQAKRINVWVENLESGKWEQGKMKLGSEKSGYCCLGVACVLNKIDFNPADCSSNDLKLKLGLKHEYGKFMSGHLEQFIKIDNDSETFNDYYAVSLADANDDGDASFEQIADIIRNNYEYIFESDVCKELDKLWK